MDWVDFFDGGLSTEQLKLGLVVAAVAVGGIVAAFLALLLPGGAPVDGALAFAGVGTIAVVLAYVGGQYVRGSRRHQVALGATTVLVMVLACVAAIALLNVASGGPGWGAMSLFTVVPVFVALVGNTAMRRITQAATLVGMGCSLVALTPAGAPVPVAGIVVSGVVVVVLDTTVGTVMTSIRGRNTARGAVNTLMSVASEAERLSDGLVDSLPLVDAVLPARGAAVVVRAPGGEPPSLLAAWTADHDDAGHHGTPRGPGDAAASPSAGDAMAGPPAGDAMDSWTAVLRTAGTDPDLAAALAAPSTVISDRWCALPIGYGPDGELLLVVQRRPAHGYHTQFAQEAADALGVCFLRLTGRLSHLDRLRQESMTDPLTGLPNRRLLLGRLQVELSRSGRSGDPVTVAMLDLDHFKRYNDEFGHLAGDEMLRTVATAVAGRMRTQDLATRYGGDELCLVLPATDAMGAQQLLDEVRQRVAEASLRHAPGAALTVSAGAAVWDGAESPESLLARADAELLRAKRDGRDRALLAVEGASAPTGPPARGETDG